MSGNPKELQDLLVRLAVGNGEIIIDRLCLLWESQFVFHWHSSTTFSVAVFIRQLVDK